MKANFTDITIVVLVFVSIVLVIDGSSGKDLLDVIIEGYGK